ncbi:proline-rich protein 2-like [Phocoena phocoena]|uniref:proline-rich protein 2-like n=1 Tax=Phocoena phocoena TaxID=9742 RepID=UPI003307C216
MTQTFRQPAPPSSPLSPPPRPRPLAAPRGGDTTAHVTQGSPPSYGLRRRGREGRGREGRKALGRGKGGGVRQSRCPALGPPRPVSAAACSWGAQPPPSTPPQGTRRPSTRLAPGRAELPDPPPRGPLPQDPGMGSPLPNGSPDTPRYTHPPLGSSPPAYAYRLDRVPGRRPLPGPLPSPDCSLPGRTPCSPLRPRSSVTFRPSAFSPFPMLPNADESHSSTGVANPMQFPILPLTALTPPVPTVEKDLTPGASSSLGNCREEQTKKALV